MNPHSLLCLLQYNTYGTVLSTLYLTHRSLFLRVTWQMLRPGSAHNIHLLLQSTFRDYKLSWMWSGVWTETFSHLVHAAADNLGLRVTWLIQKHCRPYRDTPGHLAYAEILEQLTGPHDGCMWGFNLKDPINPKKSKISDWILTQCSRQWITIAQYHFITKHI